MASRIGPRQVPGTNIIMQLIIYPFKILYLPMLFLTRISVGDLRVPVSPGGRQSK